MTFEEELDAVGRTFISDYNDEMTRYRAMIAVEDVINLHQEIVAYRIVCDEANNTPDVVDSCRMIIEVGALWQGEENFREYIVCVG